MNKKAIFASISVLILILVISISVSAFQIDNSYNPISEYPTYAAVNRMINVFQIQRDCGFFPSGMEIISISYDLDSKVILMITSFQSTPVTTDSSGGVRFYRDGSRGLVPLIWTSSGWNFPYHIHRNPSSSFGVYPSVHYYSSIQTTDSSSYTGFIGINSDPSVFGSSNVDSDSVLSYWMEFSNRINNFDSAVSEAYSEGYESGELDGYLFGYEHGYDVGYDIGFDYGEDRGYAEGQTEGYSEGYSEGESFGIYNGYRLGFDEGEQAGYESGYSEGESYGYSFGHQVGFDEGRDEGFSFGYSEGESVGYSSGHREGYDVGRAEGYSVGFSDGYESGFDDGFSDSDFNKPGQIIAQFWRYRDDSEYQGIVYFCTISHNGVSGFRWCTEDEIYSHYLNCEIYDYVYETNLYFQNHPLEFNYFVPQIVRENSPYSGALSVKSVEYRFVDLYNQRAVIELDVDPSITGLLNDKYNEGIRDSNALINGVSNIASKPISSLKAALDFEIFGINIGAVAVGLVVILFAIWAYNKIRKILPI